MSLEQTAVLRDRRAGLLELALSERNEPSEIHQFWERFYELMALQSVYRTDRQPPDYCVPPLPVSPKVIDRLHHDNAHLVYMHPALAGIENRLQLMAGVRAEWDLPYDHVLDLQNPEMPFTKVVPEPEGWLAVRRLSCFDLPPQPSFERTEQFLKSRKRYPATLNIGIVMSMFSAMSQNGRSAVLSSPIFLCLGTVGGKEPATAYLNAEVVHGARYGIQMRPQGSMKPIMTVNAEFGPDISGVYTVLEVQELK